MSQSKNNTNITYELLAYLYFNILSKCKIYVLYTNKIYVAQLLQTD